MGGGGFDLFARHLTGILAWVLVGVQLAGRWPTPVRPGRWLAVAGGLILSLALFSLLSSLWSSSVPSSLAEFERGVGLLGVFTASYLSVRTPKQREWFVRGIGAGLVVVLLLALGDRLMPGSEGNTPGLLDRLTYPLGYWNANGVVFASTLVLFVWFAALARSAPWRLFSILIASLGATGAYLTYSRGAILVATVAMVLLLFLTVRRLRVLVVLVVAIAAAAPTLITINGFPSISGDSPEGPAASESLIVILVAVAAAVVAWLVLESLLRLAAARGPLVRRSLDLSRNRRLLLVIAGTGATIGLVLTLAFGSTIWNQFTESDIGAPVDGKSRFTELSGSGRYEFNQVSIDVFTDNPWLGSGAGTWGHEWARRRDVPVVSQDAHSFYLQSLAELGIPGGLLALAIPFALISLGLVACRRGLGRDAPAALALVSALFVSVAFDWFWKLGATATLLMLLAAWIVSAEAVMPERRRAGAGPGFRIAGLLAAWVAIAILAVPAIADKLNRSSADAVRSGQVEKAVSRSELAAQLEPWSPAPHMQLGTIAESRGQFELALAEFNRAVELDPENWQAVLLRFRLNYSFDRIEDARRDFRRLQEINPVYFQRYSFEEVQVMDR